ncbi:MAG: 50S ribosomal protein L17 [Armatimonadota bacterium]
MRHRIAGRKLDLPTDQRMALLKGIVRSLIMYEHVQTTEPRAKEARAIAEKLIALAKNDSLHARRQARKFLTPPRISRSVLSLRGKEQAGARKERAAQDPVKRLFEVIAPKFADKTSGFVRITKIGFRRGDAAPIVKMELAYD